MIYFNKINPGKISSAQKYVKICNKPILCSISDIKKPLYHLYISAEARITNAQNRKNIELYLLNCSSKTNGKIKRAKV
jgi:hypothetical protein